MSYQAVVWVALLLVCVAIFWMARRFAERLNWPQRKLVLYTVVFWPILPLAADGHGVGGTIAIVGFLTAVPLFFAVLTAPEKA